MVALPNIEIGELPAKVSKRLWIEPEEMVHHIQALVIAEWAIQVSQPRRALPVVVRRGAQDGISRQQHFSHGVDSSGLANEL
jgi:hypothetical protein